MDMVTISEAVEQECFYALPRDNKVIEGPSARFAEVVASAWGNSRAGARVVSDQGEFVTAQGVFHDLQKNVAITYEVQRRITGKGGKRFSADMIGVTANAACSIALRNAILKGVPKAFWADMYEGARKTAMGDVKTLPNRRAEAFKLLQGYGVAKEQVLDKLGVKGDADIGQEQLLILRGIITAIKDGDTTPEQAFASGGDGSGSPVSAENMRAWTDEKFNLRMSAKWQPAVDKGASVQEILDFAEGVGPLTDEQRAKILALKPTAAATHATKAPTSTPAPTAPPSSGPTFGDDTRGT
jgi:predicted flap endonuclease-1-like 5' DNA nuclease